jgi:hypothetical protein
MFVLTNEDLSYECLVNSIIANQKQHVDHCLTYDGNVRRQSAGICGGQSDIGAARFSPSTSVSPSSSHSTNSSILYHRHNTVLILTTSLNNKQTGKQMNKELVSM